MNPVAFPIVTIQGRYLVREGQRFVVKGVVYQKSIRDGAPTDPLADVYVDDIHRDVKMFQDLGLNAIFVYRIDPSLSHDESMKILAEAGIYVIALASDHKNREVIIREQPRQSYNAQVQYHFHSVASCMARYRNTLGLCISNDLINSGCQKQNLVAEICDVLRQAILELKRFMRDQYSESGQRILPVCMADTFWSLTHTDTFAQLTGAAAEPNPPESRLDFYCVNHYAPPPRATQTESDESTSLPWKLIHTLPQFQNHAQHVPVLLSEYSGSNADRPRSFQETADLYSSQAPPRTDKTMLDVLSGGFVYEFFEQANQYGLVKVHRSTGAVEKLPDYDNLKSMLDTTMNR